MTVGPRSRLALLAVAAALLAAGLYGPIRRSWEADQRAERLQAQAEQVARERAQAAERFAANREQILGDLRERIARGEYIEALRIAAPFGAVADEELRALFREAANAESLRQRGAMYAQLVARDCNEDVARAAAARVLASAKGLDVPPAGPASVERLAGREARALAAARMREPPHADFVPGPGNASVAPPPDTRDWIARMRDENRARLLPDFAGLLLSPEAERYLCVWRARGERRDGARTLAYTMDLWLAPTPDGKNLAGDPVVYREQLR